ncbi:isopeptide-forming domain-containing fimbrial protein, partial [Paenibacillus sp. ISL-20]|uniref:isopeptide-forming domain-containing fimbrial protein n=1 Tax=Paenibacillus sp. ISL-20 TaxID=2819163 RepID=UPI001BE5D0DF|nr:tandem-95 repeat protein [Paenibacillus sp. ISL-20]
MVIDSAGYLWFAANDAKAIIQVNPDTGEVLRIVQITNSDGITIDGGVRGLSFLPNGQMLMASGMTVPTYFILDPNTLSTTYLGAGTGPLVWDLASRVAGKFDPNPPVLESNKKATLQEKAVGNTDAAHPEVGDTLLYTIQTRNTITNSMVHKLLISDTIPEGLEYVPGSLKIDGVVFTDAVGDDKGHYDAGQVVSQFGDITDTNWHTVQFKATIKAGQAGKNIRNVAEVTGDNIDTPDKPSVEVNVYPPANQPPMASDTQETTWKNTPVTGSVYGVDPDGDQLTFTKGSDPTNGTVTVNPDGTWTYVPDTDFTGTDSFTVTISDGKGGTITSTVTVNVTEPPNLPPVTENYDVTTEKDTSVTGSVYGTDPDGDTLTYAIESNPKHGTVIVNPDGTWKYTPDPGYVGPDIFTVTVSDGKGGVTTSTITVDVKDKPNNPPVSPGKNVTTEKGTSVTGDVYGTDPDGDPLTYTPGKQPGNGTVIVNPDGSWTYTPDPNFVGEDSFTVIVDDGKGNKTEVTVIVRVTEPTTLPTDPGNGTNPTDPGNGTNPTD